MLLNSNSYNLDFSLIGMFFLVLWPKDTLANSDFCTFTVTNKKKNEDKYLIFTLIVMKYLLVYKQCSPSPKFTLLSIISTWQQFLLLACRKYKSFGEMCRSFFRKMANHITTSFNCDCVFVILDLWFWSSFENFPILGSPVHHVNMITFDMSLQIIFLDQKNW